MGLIYFFTVVDTKCSILRRQRWSWDRDCEKWGKLIHRTIQSNIGSPENTIRVLNKTTAATITITNLIHYYCYVIKTPGQPTVPCHVTSAVSRELSAPNMTQTWSSDIARWTSSRPSSWHAATTLSATPKQSNLFSTMTSVFILTNNHK